jgi:hypothetical protein
MPGDHEMLNNATPAGRIDNVDLASVTRLQVHRDSPATTVTLAGGVGPVLQSTCVWTAGDAGAGGVGAGDDGAIRAIDMSRDGLAFGLGAAAFGEPHDQAVQQLGEYVLVDGASWWTPATRPITSRYEAPGAPILTPFLFRWDRMSTATARLSSPSPVPLVYWYEHLLRVLVRDGVCPTGAIALKVVADVPAALIVEKQLARAPLREHRPADERLITDEAHLDDYFVRNTAARAYHAWCTIVMVGIVVDPQLVAATWGPEFIERGFYTTPGISATAEAIHHTHALVTAQLPAGAAEQSRADAALDGLLTGARSAQATHIENDTLLYQADARIGAVCAVELD